MSDVWSEGYVTGVGYTYGYYRETSPVYQRFCLLLRGLACNEPDAATAHCELGFGQGVSVNINAASNPGQYVATDFNPAHAAHANAIANHMGSNLRLHDDSFEQLLARTDLPRFDSISLHGIWSWVSRENHRLITKFASQYLKPGGVFYVSYNCFPGWAPAYPLRQVLALHDRYAGGSANVAHRIDAALKFSRELLDAGPMFARAWPGFDERLKQIAGQSRDYLAHEYFNRDWNCMYFTDVADALAEARLEFATTADPLDVVDPINLTAAGIAFLNGIEHPILREQMRDYFVNQQFRKDLYLRGIRRFSTVEQREQILATRLVLERPVNTITMKLNRAQGEATLHDSLFRPLLEQLAARDYAPKSFNDLTRALPEISLPQLVTAGAVLVGAGHAAPCQAEANVRQVTKTCEALNLHLLERARTRDDVNHLASPVIGGGIAVGRFQQLFLLARSRGCDQPTDWARFTWQLLSDQGQKLVKDGKALETPEENLADLTAQANSFADDRLPLLKAAGIVH
jgi:SAM-dependent methyltransferase